jgi:hypothetical protein
MGVKVAMKAATIPAMAKESASQSAVIAPASSRQNLALVGKRRALRPRGFGIFGPSAPFAAAVDMGSVISTSTLALPHRVFGVTLPEKVVKLGQNHGQLMKNRLALRGDKLLISNRKRPRSVLNAVFNAMSVSQPKLTRTGLQRRQPIGPKQRPQPRRPDQQQQRSERPSQRSQRQIRLLRKQPSDF